MKNDDDLKNPLKEYIHESVNYSIALGETPRFTNQVQVEGYLNSSELLEDNDDIQNPLEDSIENPLDDLSLNEGFIKDKISSAMGKMKEKKDAKKAIKNKSEDKRKKIELDEFKSEYLPIMNKLIPILRSEALKVVKKDKYDGVIRVSHDKVDLSELSWNKSYPTISVELFRGDVYEYLEYVNDENGQTVKEVNVRDVLIDFEDYLDSVIGVLNTIKDKIDTDNVFTIKLDDGTDWDGFHVIIEFKYTIKDPSMNECTLSNPLDDL